MVTIDSKHKLPITATLLQRNFTAAAPNQVRTGDITYFATDEFGCTWQGCGSIQPLGGGWRMQPHMQSSLVTDALRMASFRRAPDEGVVFHSDRAR